MTVPDFPDEKAPDAHATAISLTGAPPLVLKRVLDVQVGTSIPAGGTLTRPASGAFAINQPGYEIQVNVGQVGGTAAIISVELQWYDSAFNGLIEDEIYYFYSGDVNGHQIHGRGPSKGDQVVVIVKDHSGASGVSFSYTLLQTSRTFTREFWHTIVKNQAFPAFPGFTAVTHDIGAGVIAGQAVSVPASTVDTFVLPLYTGTVRLFGVTSSASAGNNDWQVLAVTDLGVAGAVLLQGSNGQSGFAPDGVSSLYIPDTPLPRAQCVLKNVNLPAGIQTMTTAIVAQEDRS